MNKGRDITNQKFGNLTAISNTGKTSSNRYYIWLFKCDCGNLEERSTQSLKSMEKGGKCKLCVIDNLKSRFIKHSSCNSKVYNTWENIKDRCLNTRSRSYHRYGGAGITIQEDWINDFVKFRDYIGNPPDDGQRWSIDRIDNSLGYQEGNIRWATYSEQNRNKTKRRKNSLGITGVYFWKNSNYSDLGRYTARWSNLEGKHCRKSFSVKEYGEELAFFLACEYREQMINLLNLQGAGYTERHGK